MKITFERMLKLLPHIKYAETLAGDSIMTDWVIPRIHPKHGCLYASIGTGRMEGCELDTLFEVEFKDYENDKLKIDAHIASLEKELEDE